MANERFYREPHFENLGCTLTSGVFTIHGALGRDLSAANPAYVVLKSRATKGLQKKYIITANQSFTDDVGTSDIVGNTFGTTASIAWANEVPFGIYAVTSDDESTISFALSRSIYNQASPAAAQMGSPAAATADDARAFWFLNSVTLASYDANPCVMVGVINMTKTTSDDWTVVALTDYTGIGASTDYITYTMPLAQNGASTGTIMIPSGGTAPLFTTTNAFYAFLRGGWVQYIGGMSGDGGTDGVGAVLAGIAAPLPFENMTGSSNPYYGYFWLTDPTNGNQMGTFQCALNDYPAYLGLTDGTFAQNADFSNGAREIRFNIFYRMQT